MFSYPPLLLLQLAAAAAVTAILCVICHRDAEIDVRFWLAVAVAAAVLFFAAQGRAQSLAGAASPSVILVTPVAPEPPDRRVGTCPARHETSATLTRAGAGS